MLGTAEGRKLYNKIMIKARKARQELKRITGLQIMQKPVWARQDGDIDYECFDDGFYLTIEIYTEENGNRRTIHMIEQELDVNNKTWQKLNDIAEARRDEATLWHLTTLSAEDWERYLLGY